MNNDIIKLAREIIYKGYTDIIGKPNATKAIILLEKAIRKEVIKSRPNMLTSTLDLEYSNTDFECDVERTSISNCDLAWKILFNINQGCSANVFYQVWDNKGENSKEVPFLESRPYKYRNERGLFNKYKS